MVSLRNHWRFSGHWLWRSLTYTLHESETYCNVSMALCTVYTSTCNMQYIRFNICISRLASDTKFAYFCRLLGKNCASPVELKKDSSKVARQHLRSAYAFVGITGWWNLSICLFHAQFGGTVSPLSFQNSRPTHHDDVADQQGDVDESGGPITKPIDFPTDGSTLSESTADHLNRDSDYHDFAVYREAVAMFAFKLCSYGFIIPPDLVHLVRMLPWKRSLNPKCFPAEEWHPPHQHVLMMKCERCRTRPSKFWFSFQKDGIDVYLE